MKLKQLQKVPSTGNRVFLCSAPWTLPNMCSWKKRSGLTVREPKHMVVSLCGWCQVEVSMLEHMKGTGQELVSACCCTLSTALRRQAAAGLIQQPLSTKVSNGTRCTFSQYLKRSLVLLSCTLCFLSQKIIKTLRMRWSLLQSQCNLTSLASWGLSSDRSEFVRDQQRERTLRREEKAGSAVLLLMWEKQHRELSLQFDPCP